MVGEEPATSLATGLATGRAARRLGIGTDNYRLVDKLNSSCPKESTNCCVEKSKRGNIIDFLQEKILLFHILINSEVKKFV